MADRETELEWEKSKRIEAERMKAVRALEEENKDIKVNSAFLDPENRKIHGYSRDMGQLLRSAEKAADISIGLVIVGILLKSTTHILPKLGSGAAPLGILVDIISAVGFVMICVAPIMAIISLWFNYKYKDIKDYKNKNTIMTAIAALIIVVVYAVLYFFVIKY